MRQLTTHINSRWLLWIFQSRYVHVYDWMAFSADIKVLSPRLVGFHEGLFPVWAGYFMYWGFVVVAIHIKSYASRNFLSAPES